jgi:hypothetical protein
MSSKTTPPVTGPPSRGGGRTTGTTEQAPGEAAAWDRARRVGAVVAGPALIVAAVLVVQHRIAFGGMATNQHPDILAMWLPTHCFLGTSLAAGHIPAWNPHILGGTPFAADPQSGWLYLPAMVLYSAMSCGAALRWFIVFQPLLAGLGMYWFLRSERLSRVSATCGGLVMGLLIGGSYLAVQLPFGAALAWTTVLLAAASRFVRTPGGWPARLGWALATAGAWGQVASAHLSNGLVVGTFALVLYVAVAMGQEVRGGRVTWRHAAVLAAILLAALPLVNLAILLPRLIYLGRTTSALGYGELARRAAALAGKPAPPTPVGVTSRASWPLTLIGPVGGYAGAAALALALGGWRRSKALFLTFVGFGGVCYLLSLEGVAQALSHVLSGSTVGNFYLHVPSRFSDGVVLAIPVLVALGVEAWRHAEPGWKRRLSIVAPGILVWWVVAPLAGVVHQDAWLPVAGGVLGAAILVAALRRPAVLVALPVLLAVELATSGLAGQAPRFSLHGAVEVPAEQLAIPPLRRPEISVARYLRAGPIARALRRSRPSRYTSIPPTDHRGLIPYQQPRYWPLLGNQRAVLFGLDTADGVNPVQSVRHWSFVRATQRRQIYYNASFYLRMPPLAANLLGVNDATIDAATGCKKKKVGGPAQPVVTEGEDVLCRLDAVVPRATVIRSWRVVATQDDALDAVIAPGFDPDRTVVLERNPGIGRPGKGSGRGRATYRDAGPQAAVVDVTATGPAVVLVRTSYDPFWRATVDGRPTPVLAADYVDLGVAVPGGHHVIELSYDDHWVGRGVLASAVVVAGMGMAAAGIPVAGRLRRRRRVPGEPVEP